MNYFMMCGRRIGYRSHEGTFLIFRFGWLITCTLRLSPSLLCSKTLLKTSVTIKIEKLP